MAGGPWECLGFLVTQEGFFTSFAQGKGSQQCRGQGQLGCTGDAGGGSGLAQPLHSTY